MSQLFGAVAILAVLAVPERPPAADPDKRDAVARELAQAFCKGVLARDLDAVMRVVDVPWCSDAREIIEDKDTVREEFRKNFAEDKPRDFSGAKVHIRKIATLAEFRKQNKAPPVRKVSLGEVLGKNDRIVFLEIENAGRFQPVWLGIRFNDKKGKVVGFVD